MTYPFLYGIIQVRLKYYLGGAKKMAEDLTEKTEEKSLSFETADDLTDFLIDLQGQIANLTETVDKIKPVEDDPAEETTEEPKEESVEEEVREEEISEIDKILQRS